MEGRSMTNPKNDNCVSEELCRARHGEVMNAIGHLEKKIDNALIILAGNGKPGLRETQLQVESLANWRSQCEANTRTVWESLFRAALPYAFPFVLFLLYLFYQHTTGGNAG